MILEFSNKGVIDRKDALWCIGRYLHFVPKDIRKEVFREMQRENLIEKANGVKANFHHNGSLFRIVNPEASECVACFVPKKIKRKENWSWRDKW